MEAVSSPAQRPAQTGRALATLSGICRSFMLGHTTVRALHKIDFTIHYGEMVAVWGPSGSGKSSLMNIIGLIDRPDSGTLTFDGSDVSRLDDNRLSDYRSKHVGFVFQSFNLVPVLSALENVMLPLQIQGVATSCARRKAKNLLESVGLEQHLRFRPDRLSGGQRQRTAIARALITDPKLVIADEPTASLDSENSQNVINLMQSLNQKTGTTFLFATHDQRLLDHIPRTLLLKDGVIAQDLQGEPQ